ncbi:hypothetical protein [Paenibacillus pinihumi]|uniref:hypothetical protein n=1 Tax=Paenibacillus pinihumi TaxID=669462 RepID=UPI0004039E83|nr:hypothetical protein [Paenibacillus pinihumi]
MKRMLKVLNLSIILSLVFVFNPLSETALAQMPYDMDLEEAIDNIRTDELDIIVLGQNNDLGLNYNLEIELQSEEQFQREKKINLNPIHSIEEINSTKKI